MAEPTRQPERWGTRIGVILAVMGSAVGLGNFLRFPGLAAKYEGGAFMIPYFIALFVLGLPLAWGEWAMGRYGGTRGFNSTPGIYRAIWPRKISPYLGVLGMLVPVGIYMYYIYIEAWCLGYAWNMLTGKLTLGADWKNYDAFFTTFVGADKDGVMFQGASTATTFLLICIVLNFVLIYRGLTGGIEWFCKWAMPALVVCAIIVLARVLTMPGISHGLGFMWNPRTGDKGLLENLANGQMWLEATGQIFFSLSVGFGIIITYASYLRPNDDIALSSLTSCAGNEFCEVALGGMITIPAAFILLGTAAVGSSFDLGFKTLPMVFASMPMGRTIGVLFFFLLFLAAITSSLSMLQPAIALLEEGLGLNRRASVAMLGFVTLMGTGLVVWFSKGLLVLDQFDFWVGTFCIYLLAMFQTILFGWILGVNRGMEELNRGGAIRIPRFVGFMLKYVSSTYLIGIFVIWLYQQITAGKDNYFKTVAHNPAAQLAVAFLVIVAVFFTLLVHQSVRRWNRIEAAQQEVML